MKKRKILFLFVILFGIMFIPLFSACKNNDGKIRLIAPESVNYQINFDTNKQMLVTQENPFASSYVFGFSEYESQNTNDYIHIQSDTYYCDVSDYFVNAKTYYFYAQYVGTGNYSDSPISPIKSQTIQYVLEQPYLSIDENVLSWTPVLNAADYSIYSVIGNVKEYVTNRVSTNYNISQYVSQKLDNGLDEAIKFTVIANPVQSANFLRSPESNYVSYSAYLQLAAPEIISVNKSNITFTSVPHCNSYTLKINSTYSIVITKNQCSASGNNLVYNLSQYFAENGLGEYIFKIKSNNTNNYIESDFSAEYSFVNTQKLNAPTEIIITNENPNIVIYWSPVTIPETNEYVDEYELFFSDVRDGYRLKQFIVNQGGVDGSILTNSIMLTFEQMKISSFDELKSSQFKLQVRSKGKGYYTNSDFYSNFRLVDQDNSLNAPVITDNASESKIIWSKVNNAAIYKVKITGPISREISTAKLYFEYEGFLSEAGDYTIVCFAVGEDDRVSQPSNSILKVVEQQDVNLEAPVLNSVSLDDDSLVFDFTPSANATTYSLYAYNNLISEEITKTSRAVSIVDVLQYKQNDKISFQLKANGFEHFIESEKSNSVTFNTKLQTPVINISGNSLTWQAIANATSYTLFIDNNEHHLNSIEAYLDLTQYVTQINVARQVRIRANNLYLGSSEISDYKYYNRADRGISNYTNRYFYYGQTYDYYITSAQEFFDAIQYTQLNFLPELKVYINYDTSKTVITKYNEISDNIHGSINFMPSIPQNIKVGSVTITFNYADLSREPDYDFQYTNFAHDMKYVANSTRDANYQFPSDNYLVSQDVYTTNGLLSAIEHHAKPNFKTSNYVAKGQYTVEDVYNRAKEILIEICDDSMSDYEKVLSIHDYVVTNVEYDYQGRDTVNAYNRSKTSQLERLLGYYHYIESAIFYNFAVCDGYAKLFSLLCNMEGIDCVVVDGLADSSDSSSGHAWNKVCFDLDGDGEKEWFSVDCTYDDQPTTSKTSYLTHQYFLIPDSYIGLRSEDVNVFAPYESTTYDVEKFYSYYTVDDIPLKIDDPMQLSQKAMKYMDQSIQFNLELIVLYDSEHKAMVDMVISALSTYNIHNVILSYDHNNNYKNIYLYR